MSLTVIFLLRLPYVPVMVIVDFPVAADPLAFSVLPSASMCGGIRRPPVARRAESVTVAPPSRRLS
jgi:hypothetical protein